MSRPRSPRTIASHPVAPLFKPGGVRAAAQVRLGEDEFEALRLADVDGLQQADAAEHMGISRQTFGRILTSARRKVARSLVLGLALRIDGAPGAGRGLCSQCGNDAQVCASCAQALVQLPTKGGAGSGSRS
jgi:predicted DNA-binding protein (UPF0251 family)